MSVSEQQKEKGNSKTWLISEGAVGLQRGPHFGISQVKIRAS